MDIIDNIKYQAVMNSKGVYPKNEDDINKDLPYIQIYKDSNEKLEVACYNYETHDNAPRMAFYSHYLKYAIFPNIEKECQVTGFYNIELHDSYTYLNNNKNYKDTFVFSKFKTDNCPVLLPDPYMVSNWGNKVITDTKEWTDKQDKVCFFGTTTGNRDPSKNRRISMCKWAINKENYNFKISNIAQMTSYDILNKMGINTWRNVYRNQIVPFSEQLDYKFHFAPDGNTCKFDVWNYGTNTVIFKDISNDMLWYYPLMKNGEHFVEVDENTMESKRIYYVNNPKESLRIIDNSKRLYLDLFKPENHIIYTSTLFNTIG